MITSLRRLYLFSAQRAYNIIIFGALFCTLAVKLSHSLRLDQLNQYPSWILSDIAFLITAEALLTLIYRKWPNRLTFRIFTITAAILCTWSVMNAGWIIRTGTQILPTVLLPLFRDPLNSFTIIGVNLAKMPRTAIILLAPSAIALAFVFAVITKPHTQKKPARHSLNRFSISCGIIAAVIIAQLCIKPQNNKSIAAANLTYNSQLHAIKMLILPDPERLTRADMADPKRIIPTHDQIKITPPTANQTNNNIVIVILEGVQYSHTSLAPNSNANTPFLSKFAAQAIEFTNMRSTLTHTTKALFALLTGRFPSISQDIAEAVPAQKPYASIATILKDNLSYRTAFFQSAKGNFESRPALIHNLGFENFWAREDLADPNTFVGSLGSDEFSMLEPAVKWAKSSDKPFLLVILCSVTHDPYQVPQWFAEPAKDPIQSYNQAITYTDQFLAALDTKLTLANLNKNTIFCIVGDHGEGFGEHGLFGHERIGFEEVLRVPLIIRIPNSIGNAPSKINEPVSSIDLTPTLLALTGFETNDAKFDGTNLLNEIPTDRKIFFSGWMQQSPSGYVINNKKWIYYPDNKTMMTYDLNKDPGENKGRELQEPQAAKIRTQIIEWRKNNIFRLNQQTTGTKMIFNKWLCRWNNRIATTKYQDLAKQK